MHLSDAQKALCLEYASLIYRRNNNRPKRLARDEHALSLWAIEDARAKVILAELQSIGLSNEQILKLVYTNFYDSDKVEC